MALKLVVAVTDWDWFQHLSAKQDLAEVNFWAPSASTFKALEPGELFLFKLHSPRNFIAGGGVFTYANNLPCSLAWDSFGEANGAKSLNEMRRRIARYRRADADDRSNFSIGCRILTRPCFLQERDWIPVPESWSKNIVAFKSYSLDDADGRMLWQAFEQRCAWQDVAEGFAENQARYGEPVLVEPRLGQGAFRVLVTDHYNRRCAVTGERTLPALDAAHIRPYADGGAHKVANGLLLRRDIHSLFDAGYVTVTHDYRFEVSKRIREEFENGRLYYAMHGNTIALPARTDAQPDIAALRWHNEERFRG